MRTHRNHQKRIPQIQLIAMLLAALFLGTSPALAKHDWEGEGEHRGDAWHHEHREHHKHWHEYEEHVYSPPPVVYGPPPGFYAPPPPVVYAPPTPTIQVVIPLPIP